MRLYNQLKEEIENRTLVPGTMLPRETELAAMRGVSRVTLRAVLKKLEDEKLVTRVRGHGTFVRKVKRPTRITMLLPCSNWMVRSNFSSVLIRNLLSGVMKACSAHNCVLTTIETSPSNSPEDIQWSNLDYLGKDDRILIFGFWFQKTFRFLKACGSRVVVISPQRNRKLPFDRSSYPHVPFLQEDPPANWSFLSPDVSTATKCATEYLINKYKCKRPGIIMYDCKVPGNTFEEGYRAGLAEGMPHLAVHSEDFSSSEELADHCRRNGIDGLIYDVRRLRDVTNSLDVPVIRYPAVLDGTLPCLADDYDLIGDMAVQMLLKAQAPDETYPITLKLD